MTGGSIPIAGLLLSSLLGLWCAGSNSESESPLIEFQRSGGIRGTDDRLSVAADGSARLRRNGETTSFTLDSGTVRRIRRALEASDFGDLQRAYEPPRGGADMYEYRITYGGHSVRAAESALPQALHPVVELLDGIIQRGR